MLEPHWRCKRQWFGVGVIYATGRLSRSVLDVTNLSLGPRCHWRLPVISFLILKSIIFFLVSGILLFWLWTMVPWNWRRIWRGRSGGCAMRDAASTTPFPFQGQLCLRMAERVHPSSGANLWGFPTAVDNHRWRITSRLERDGRVSIQGTHVLSSSAVTHLP